MTTDSATPVPDEGQGAFDVAPTAIPIGVRCRSCGRLHLPARLWPLSLRTRPGGRAEIDLRCVRCNAVGSLLLDPESTEHRRLLAVWRDQMGGAPGDGVPKEPA
jgi:hypothetical protein